MHSPEYVARLYEACGYSVKPHVAARLLATPAHALRDCYGVVTSRASGGGAAAAAHHDVIAFERKMWRAHRVASWIACLPFVRGIAVCNSLGFQMVHEDSDIDLFIITAPDRVWSARWWVTGLLALLRMRPGEARRDPVCVSFYLDESVSDISRVKIEKDVYFHYWLRSLLPLFGTHPLFVDAAHTAPQFRVGDSGYIQRALEFFARILSENFVHRQQENIMPDDLKEAAEEQTTNVILDKDIVKLHVNDRRREIRDKVFETSI